jgi:hypothetical protein
MDAFIDSVTPLLPVNFWYKRLIFSDEKYKFFKNNVIEKIYLVKRHPALSRLGNPFTTDKSLDYYCRYF